MPMTTLSPGPGNSTLAVEQPTRLPVMFLVVAGLVVVVVSASALLGPVSEPEFFITYALVQGAVFLGLVYLADLYEREPISIVGLMVLWGGTVACVIALPGNAFVENVLPGDVQTVFGAAISAPVVEEASKGLALLLAFWLSELACRRLGTQPFEGLTDGLVYGAAVGMGFAFTEDIFYFVGQVGESGLEAGFDLFKSRVDFFGLNMLGHAVYSGLFGAGLGAASVLVRRRDRILAGAGGFGAAALAHAVHNGLVEAVLTARFGLSTTAAALNDEEIPDDIIDPLLSTAYNADRVRGWIDVGLVVALFLAVALWIRYQQRVIASELADEDPDVAPPDDVSLVIHYGRRLVAFVGLLRAGRVDEWRLARILNAELVKLSFLKRRVRQGRADISEVDRQRFLTAWAAAALRSSRDKPGKGSSELLALSDEALRSSRYDLAESLLALRADLVLPDEVTRGQLAVIAGRQLAESAFRPEEAIGEYTRAVACFDRALARDPDDAIIHQERAGALFRLGEAQTGAARPDGAVASYEEAIAAADAALVLDPVLPEAHRNRGAASLRLGEAELARSRPTEAAARFRGAIGSSDATLHLAPDDARAHNIAAMAWRGLAEAQSALDRAEEAAASCQQAIAAADEAIRLVPDFAYAHLNKGLAWARLAELAAAGGRGGDAETAYGRALAAYDGALAGNPEYVKALAERGAALTGLGRVQAAGDHLDEAAGSASAALESCEAVRSLAPGYGPVHRYRAEALLLRAELGARQGQRGAAMEATRAALAACDDAQRLASGDPGLAAPRARAEVLLASFEEAGLAQGP